MTEILRSQMTQLQRRYEVPHVVFPLIDEELFRSDILAFYPNLVVVQELQGYDTTTTRQPIWGDYLSVYNPVRSSLTTLTPEAWPVVSTISQGIADIQAVSQETGFAPDYLKQITADLRSKVILLPLDKTLADEFHKPNELEVYLGITTKCNLCCDGCSVDIDQTLDEQSHAQPKTMEVATLQLLLEETVHSASMEKMEKVRLKWAGGEPLLQDSFRLIMQAQEAIGRLREQYLDIQIGQTIVTNGTFLTEEVVAALSRLDVHVSVSLWGLGEINDKVRGASRTQDKYPNILAGIKRLHEASIDHPNLTYNINHVIRPDTASHFADFVTALWDTENDKFIGGRDWRWEKGKQPIPIGIVFLRPKRTDQIAALQAGGYESMLDGTRGGFEVMRQLIKKGIPIPPLGKIDMLQLFILKEYPCGSGTSYIAATPDGRVSSCHDTLLKPDKWIKVKKDGGNLLEQVNAVAEPQKHWTKFPDSVDLTKQYILGTHGGIGCPHVAQLENQGKTGIAASVASALYTPLVDDILSLETMRRLKMTKDTASFVSNTKE